MRSITHPNDFTMPELPISDDNVLPFIIIGCVAIGSICIHFLVTFILRRVAANSGWTFDHEIVKHCAACIILTFPQGWELGASLLASASVTALFIGLAAKPSLENLIASLQIALTQPLLLDDYVVIDGFAGTVEEIKSQYIVLRSLEERRFIIPLARVTTYTFQNWSRTNESISTTFNLFVDYGIPLEDLRHQFFNLVEKNDRWDRRDASLNISEAKENSLMLAGTVSAVNIHMARIIKTQIQEKLIEYMVTTYPQYLPRARSERVPSRTGVDSMKKVVSKMDEAIIL
ncbi:238_t:CDS:2 [Cetraspora pellucida]|uniref:238_t:CDS:1 n=1 Tax=Cetraspora pellucida TaxID=1433469 RepID=A0ACA9N449_9GLOM|nr:238_t:CDS:2 [Cetraspora pellucida]